jgi:ribonuclease P protein component
MRKHGFSRSCRLTERPQFVRLFDKPQTYKSRTFQAYWKQNEKMSARLGITLKGRLSSVWRMRLKRIIREWFRVAKAEIGPNDLNIVIHIPVKLDMAFADLLKTQLEAWKS